MDETLRQLGGLLLGSIPTIILLTLLYVTYKAVVYQPLRRVLADEYEQRLREARMALFKRQEERRQMALQARSAAVAEARAKAQAQVSQARAAIEQDKTAAQTALQAEAGRLATEIVRTVLQPVSAAVQTPVGGGL